MISLAIIEAMAPDQTSLEAARKLLVSKITRLTLTQLILISDLCESGNNARAFAAMGIPVFACTPDQFPDLMAVALTKGDISAWAAKNGIIVII